MMWMMPEMTRRSSTLGTPRTLWGDSGRIRSNWVSDSQKWWSDMMAPTYLACLNHGSTRLARLSMGPEPGLAGISGEAVDPA